MVKIEQQDKGLLEHRLLKIAYFFHHFLQPHLCITH